MSAAPAPRLPMKAVVGLAISVLLLITAVVLEYYAHRTKHAVVTEQPMAKGDNLLLRPLPTGAIPPTVEELAPPEQPQPHMQTPDGNGTLGQGPFMRGTPPPDSGGDVKVVHGRELVQRLACAACHSLDGSALASSSFKGMFGRETTLVDGTKLIIDEAYIRESIVKPEAKKAVVPRPTPPMPSFADKVSEADIEAIIAYIKTLK